MRAASRGNGAKRLPGIPRGVANRQCRPDVPFHSGAADLGVAGTLSKVEVSILQQNNFKWVEGAQKRAELGIGYLSAESANCGGGDGRARSSGPSEARGFRQRALSHS